MTRKLEALFNLNSDESEPDQLGPDLSEPEPAIKQDIISTETLATIEKVENALPQVRGLESSDEEMDEIANIAKEAFNNLFDLGMQTDPRFSAEIFSVGSNMLGHALTAKTAKMQKKLKMIDLQLKKAELDRKISLTKADKPDETPLGTGQVIDRNELIKMVLNQAASKNDKKDK
jgi:hypothetical protein